MSVTHDQERNREFLAAMEKAVNAPAPPPPDRWRWFFIFSGVILPLIALGVELLTRMCANAFFNPIPTIWHALLYAGIALVNALVLLAYSYQWTRYMRWLALANGAAISIAFLYSLPFIPLAPIGLIMILLFGLGLCAISPLLAFVATLRCRKYLCAMAPGQRAPALWPGLLLGVVLIILVELPSTLTMLGMQMATSTELTTRQRGIGLLRTVGSRSTMLHACYGRNSVGGFLSMLLGVNDPVTEEEARPLYYLVTGHAFNTEPRPWMPEQHEDFFWGSRGDSEQGQQAVAGQVEGLSMATSQFDATVDAQAAVGYLEWTLVFKNDSVTAQEARAQILLPHDAVVSRLTLWVNGEPREAAFHARGRVTQAYREVAVVQQRDPVLVTSCGPDRVLVQCFPVPANGGAMKVRLGITAPLMLKDREHGVLMLPAMIEKNFTVPDNARHTVWVESHQPLQAGHDALRRETTGGVHAVRGDLPDAVMGTPAAAITCERNAAILTAWTPDPLHPKQYAIVQTIADARVTRPERIILVLDGSEQMQAALPGVAKALASLPQGSEFAVLQAGDAVSELVPLQQVSHAAVQQAARRISEARCQGGVDNIPALCRAWDIAAEKRGVIVWVHGAQPVVLSAAETLLQRYTRRPQAPPLFAVQVGPGPNRILENVDGIDDVRIAPRLGTVGEDVQRVFAQWDENARPLTVTRQRMPVEKAQHAGETSRHLARLWANEQARVFYRQGGKQATEMAVATAREYQLVTPVTGAVVLENQQQYKDAGLEPVKEGTVPTVPEPETWMMLAVALVMLMVIWWRRRQTCALA